MAARRVELHLQAGAAAKQNLPEEFQRGTKFRAMIGAVQAVVLGNASHLAVPGRPVVLVEGRNES